jgi:5-methylcytosine-specific restriction endonuclease McrA
MPECLHPDGRALYLALRGTDDPWAPTVDHVIPLSEGGSDDKGNYRAAHFRCNQAAVGIHPAERPPPRVAPPRLTYRLGEVFDPEMLDRLVTEKIRP